MQGYKEEWQTLQGKSGCQWFLCGTTDKQGESNETDGGVYDGKRLCIIDVARELGVREGADNQGQ